jgi:hypothetical protein
MTSGLAWADPSWDTAPVWTPLSAQHNFDKPNLIVPKIETSITPRTKISNDGIVSCRPTALGLEFVLKGKETKRILSIGDKRAIVLARTEEIGVVW